jgi:hypothetical protein
MWHQHSLLEQIFPIRTATPVTLLQGELTQVSIPWCKGMPALCPPVEPPSLGWFYLATKSFNIITPERRR